MALGGIEVSRRNGARTLSPDACRLVIVGCSCSGKTTLAAALARRLGAEHIELDGINNLPGWRDRDQGETRAIVSERIKAPRWVVDGNYRWLADVVWPMADVVIVLDPPLHTVLRRVLLRTSGRILMRRELWNGNRETLANVFSRDPRRSIVRWALRSHPRYRQIYRQMLTSPDAAPKMVHLTSGAQVRRLLQTVPAVNPDGAIRGLEDS